MFRRILAVLLLGGALAAATSCDLSSGSSSALGAPPDSSASSGSSANDNSPKDVKLEVLKFANLEEAIQAQKGKIVVVDVWATDCIPCRKEFPHLVELHQKHAKDGVVCLSVSTDKAKAHGAALEFLKEKGATFTNYRIDDAGVLRDKWNFSGNPAVRVYDRTGKVAHQYADDTLPESPASTYDEVNKLVERLLAKGSGK